MNGNDIWNRVYDRYPIKAAAATTTETKVIQGYLSAMIIVFGTGLEHELGRNIFDYCKTRFTVPSLRWDKRVSVVGIGTILAGYKGGGAGHVDTVDTPSNDRCYSPSDG